jgi:hypothetical protein
MAIKDVFNNSNDNYLKTGLAPCTGSDTNIFQFFPKKEVGVSNGSQILQLMNLGDIQIEVTAWDQNKKILGPGEVTYIPGLTKELSNRSQTFNSFFSILDSSLLYMSAQFTIKYNENFKSVILPDITVFSDPNKGITIENAVDLALGNINIGVNMVIDTSTVKFTGNTPGYNFNVSNVTLQNTDASSNNMAEAWSVTEDLSKDIQYAKYINGAMLGVVLKATYPIDQITYDKWLYISHVNNTFSYWENPDYVTKIVDTGSATNSTPTTICAGDYLNYITVNNMWDKIGYLYAKVNTFDQDNTSTKNLVPGFYIFNPHSFPVEIDYMMIN